MSKAKAVRVITAGVVMLASARPAPSAEIELPFTDGKTIRNGEGFVVGGALFVSYFGSIDRMVMEYDLSGLPRQIVSGKWKSWLNNFNLGDAEVDILDFYAFAGDGVVSIDEFEAGTWFESLEYSEDVPPFYIQVDVTQQVQDLISAGETYLGVRVSTETSSVWIFGSSAASDLPDPFLVIEWSPFSLGDYADFAECMTGPGEAADAVCSEVFDFDGDGDVDLRDFRVLQNCLAE